MYYVLLILFFIFFILFSHFCSANNDRCEHFFDEAEQTHAIQKNTLKAIAYTESGKHLSPHKIIAWPWSMNVKGKGYIFKTKQKAIIAARFLLQLGFNNFDVGCMQINLKHHPQAFKNIEEAFDPKKNVHYAATFLKNLFQEHQNWDQAIRFYHNAQEKFHTPYHKKVIGYFRKISMSTFHTDPLEEDLSILENAFYESDRTFFKDAKKSATQPQQHPAPINTTQNATIFHNKPVLTTISSNRISSNAHHLPKGLSVSYYHKHFTPHRPNVVHVQSTRLVGNTIQKQENFTTTIKQK